jgi:hypothetical protein
VPFTTSFEFEVGSSKGVLDTLCDKVGQWFSLGTPVCTTTITGRHHITEILLKVSLNTIIILNLREQSEGYGDLTRSMWKQKCFFTLRRQLGITAGGHFRCYIYTRCDTGMGKIVQLSDDWVVNFPLTITCTCINRPYFYKTMQILHLKDKIFYKYAMVWQKHMVLRLIFYKYAMVWQKHMVWRLIFYKYAMVWQKHMVLRLLCPWIWG